MTALTAEQAALATTVDSCVVLSGPGAGKTRAVIARLLDHPAPDPGRGVALLSFTNAVVDEANARALNAPDRVAFPNHLSTIDSFIYEFIVAPCWATRTQSPSRYAPSREELVGKWFDIGGLWYSLEWFDLAPGAQDSLVLRGAVKKSLGWPKGPRLESLNSAATRHWLERRAEGYFDADSCRKLAIQYLAEPALRSAITKLLNARFFELIVDEAQDMAEFDYEVVTLFRESNARVILVGDPDQSIYSFRGGDPRFLDAAEGYLGAGPPLTANFRSSPAICDVVTALRAGTRRDVPSGPQAENPQPVLLLDLGEAADFSTRLRAAIGEDWHADDVVVVAYAGNVAESYATGMESASGGPSDGVLNLAKEIEALWVGHNNPAARARSLSRTGRLLRALSTESEGDLVVSDDTLLEMASSVGRPTSLSREKFIARLVRQLGASPHGSVKPEELLAPTDGPWFAISSGTQSALKWGTIHSMKGLEAPVVVVICPDPENWQTGFGEVWRDRAEGETRRVLYVAASRASELLVLAAGPAQTELLATNLTRDGVPFTDLSLI